MQSKNTAKNTAKNTPKDSETSQKPSWFVYILRCADNTLYTGITTDVKKRLEQHNGTDNNGAKYTRHRRPVKLVYQEPSESRSEASKREHSIKSLKKPQKESLIDIYQNINIRESLK